MRATAPLEERVSRLRSRGGFFRVLLDCENRHGGANDVAWGDGVLLAVFADAHSSPASPCPFSISVSSSSSFWMHERDNTYLQGTALLGCPQI